MHIAIGYTALQIIRSIRLQGDGAFLEWFEEIENPVGIAFTPGFAGKQPDLSANTPKAERDLFAETLECEGFPFDAVIANKRIDLSVADNLGLLDRKAVLELGAFDASRKAQRKTLRTWTLRRDMPAKALIGAGKNTCFASPELVVAQLASRLDAPRLAQIIMELAGHYSLPPAQSDSHLAQKLQTAYELKPVTTIERIRKLAAQVRMLRGRDTLARALDIAMEHSASPAETILAIMMSMPMDSGGYEFETPLLNPSIDIPEEHRPHVSQQSYHPDIFFQGCYADLEYESSEFHLDPLLALQAGGEMSRWHALARQKAAADRKRMREIQTFGIAVIAVVWEDLLSVPGLDRVAWALACRVEQLQGTSAVAHFDALNQYKRRIARDDLLASLRESSAPPYAPALGFTVSPKP